MKPEPSPGYVSHPRPRREIRWFVIGATVSLMVLGFVTTALSPALAVRHPLLLLVLEAPIRNMLLASRVAVVPFLLVVTLRRLLGAVLYFLVGRWYGDAAVDWLERRAGSHGAKVRKAERAVRAGAYPLVFLAPTAVVCTVAGAMGLRPVVFVAVAGAGALCVGAVVRFAGTVLANPIARLVSVFEHHLLASTLTAAVLAAGAMAWNWRSRRRVVRTPTARPGSEAPLG